MSTCRWHHLGALLCASVLLTLSTACAGSTDDTLRSPNDAPVPAQAPNETSAPVSLPGDAADDPFVRAGSVLGVVAIRYDETLPIRSVPGTTGTELATLPPLTDNVVATGEHRLLGIGDYWHEVTAAGVTGWADAQFLRFVAPTANDVTGTIVSRLGSTPTASTMEALGQVVADSVASDDQEVTSRVVIAVTPTSGPTGTVTYDVVDFPDDSVAGDRLLVTGRQVTSGTLPPSALRAAVVYELVSVQSTSMCYRGVTNDGLCV